MKHNSALILVDLQNDFCPGGNLAVPKGDEVIPLANELQKYFDLIIATKDWHPETHTSFASNHKGHRIGDVVLAKNIEQILWPDHCIQESHGSEFHPDLDTSRIRKIFYKGTDKNIDSYSAFFDNAHLRSTGLSDYLKENQIKDVYILGLATDYCVKFSACDAAALGFNVSVIQDACRGVDLSQGDSEKAFQAMKDAGVKIINAKDLIIS